MKNYLFKYAWRSALIPLFLMLVGYYFSSFKLFFIGLIIIFILFNFYRIPDIPNTPPNDDIIYSPASGEIIDIRTTNELLTISIYLNIFSPHVQYYPCDSHILKQQHINGRHHYTYNLEKSNHNERIINILSTKHGMITITQFAGIITQELISFNKVGMNMKQRDELGFIKLGSRVDITIPNKVMKLLVNIGDKVKGGDTILAEYF